MMTYSWVSPPVVAVRRLYAFRLSVEQPSASLRHFIMIVLVVMCLLSVPMLRRLRALLLCLVSLCSTGDLNVEFPSNQSQSLICYQDFVFPSMPSIMVAVEVNKTVYK